MFITYETAASKAEDKNWDAEQQQPYVLNLNVEVPQRRADSVVPNGVDAGVGAAAIELDFMHGIGPKSGL
jgi:hypothetical protein